MPVEWTPSRYGESYSAVLSGGLRLSVTQEIGTRGGPPAQYRVAVFESTLKRKFDTSAEAKDAAVRVAKKQIAEASAVLSS